MITFGNDESVEVLVRCPDPRCNRPLHEKFQDAMPLTYLGGSLAIYQWAHPFLSDLAKIRRLGVFVSKIILVDHSDCRAFHYWLQNQYRTDAARWHRHVLTNIAEQINRLEPALPVETLFLDLNTGQLTPLSR